jgi:hypothetical protein
MFTRTLSAAFILACAATAPAQVCGLEAEPLPGLGLGPGVSEIVDALAVFEGELYISGGKVMDAGGRAWHATMRWDGSHWSPVGGADSPRADLMVVHNDGSGPGLVVAGEFEGAPPELRLIRRWKGGRWEAMGDGLRESTGRIVQLRQIREAGRDVLYAVGGRLSAGGRLASVARWEGAEWAPVGDEPTSFSDIELFKGDLYATNNSPVPGAVYRLEGEQWVAVPEIPGGARMLRAYSEPGGEYLYLGGVVGSAYLGRFNGSIFEPVSLALLSDYVRNLEVAQEDGREFLYAAGSADGEPRSVLYRYDGEEWTVAGLFYGGPYGVQKLAGAEFRGDSYLLVGGAFESVDGVNVQSLALRGPGGWESVGRGAPPVITAIEEGPGPSEAIYLSGFGLYDTAGAWLGYAAVVDGGAAQPLGEALPRPADDLHFHDDGAGPVLYAAGHFLIDRKPHAVLRWDGAEWEAFGERLDGGGLVLHSFDDGTGHALYLGGSFFGGFGTLNKLARWRSGAWEPVGEPFSGGSTGTVVFTLETSAALGEPRLFAGGLFQRSGTTEELYGLAWWDPDSGAWLPFPGHPIGKRWNGQVSHLRAVDNPSGAKLYAGGFLELPGSVGSFFAVFDGATWRPIGREDRLRAWVMYSSGRPPFGIVEPLPGSSPEDRLIASGVENFTVETISGQIIEQVAVFDGARWCDPQADDVILASARAADGSFIIGGRLTRFAGMDFVGVARFRDSACYADCDRDGSLTFFDFLCFQNLFAAMDPGADCDGDGAFTFFDFLCFQNAFAAGCP